MGAFAVFPLATIIAAILYTIGAVNFICGIIILIIKLVFDKKRSYNVILPLSVFLVFNGVFIAVSTSLFLGKFVLFLIEISK